MMRLAFVIFALPILSANGLQEASPNTNALLDKMSNFFNEVNAIHMVLQGLRHTVDARYSETMTSGILLKIDELQREIDTVENRLDLLTNVPDLVGVKPLLQQTLEFARKVSTIKTKENAKVTSWTRSNNRIPVVLNQLESIEYQLLMDMRTLTSARRCMKLDGNLQRLETEAKRRLETNQAMLPSPPAPSLKDLKYQLENSQNYEELMDLQIPEELLDYVNDTQGILDQVFCYRSGKVRKRTRRNVVTGVPGHGTSPFGKFRQLIGSLRRRNDCSTIGHSLQRAVCETLESGNLNGAEEKEFKRVVQQIQSGRTTGIVVSSKRMQSAVKNFLSRLNKEESFAVKTKDDLPNQLHTIRRGDCSVWSDPIDRAICETRREEDLDANEEAELRVAAKKIQSGSSSISVSSKRLEEAVKTFLDNWDHDIKVSLEDRRDVSTGVTQDRLVGWYDDLRNRPRREAAEVCFSLSAYLKNSNLYQVPDDVFDDIEDALGQLESPPVVVFPVIPNRDNFVDAKLLPWTLGRTNKDIQELKSTLASNVKFDRNLLAECKSPTDWED
ncbi:uncharacterized protein [Ptychodera flava]|uniref:uncharacterized protein n=1 Tax=Ptychodera flava TaxID=63121 RepID=UPI00396A6CB9